eukprot:5205128-Amphidinium_carterae.1
MDPQRDDHLLASHNLSGVEDGHQDVPSASALEEALPEVTEQVLEPEPGKPADFLEEQVPGTP